MVRHSDRIHRGRLSQPLSALRDMAKGPSDHTPLGERLACRKRGRRRGVEHAPEVLA